MPASAYRARHRFTVGRDTPTRSAISAFSIPSEANNTIRARCASPARTDPDRGPAGQLLMITIAQQQRRAPG